MCIRDSLVRAELETAENEESAQLETPKKVVVRKCCKENEILVEVDVGRRVCRLRSDYLAGMVFIIVLQYLCYFFTLDPSSSFIIFFVLH